MAVEFKPIQLTDESLADVHKRIANTGPFGSIAVHGAGLEIADRLPAGLEEEQVATIAADVA
jgi:hypothetical protein